ncbi:MAG: hypothetical protein N2Z22_07165 [Turneriella sp.]|nr:hypothetical protein [Turneriella sp.]
MWGKFLSIASALLALSLAVLYAQKKGREKPRPDPVFETSKSGLPTPIDATEEEKERIRKLNENFESEKYPQENKPEHKKEVAPQKNSEPEEKWPEPKEYPRKKKNKRPVPY